MHPAVSQAEIEVFCELSRQGLTSGMTTQKMVILKATYPDFCWVQQKKAVYLDGNPIHQTTKAKQRDAEIDELLELHGWQVLRIPYEPPLTQEMLQQIVVQLRK
ncbi:MAG: endonuclease domain-containing protein, partial [Nitrososphaerota archaeon]|nr:endonuclease domain-containing protein [Nitrososphaerota archaeon]